MARREEQTCSGDNDACGAPVGAGLWIRSSETKFALLQSLCRRFS